MFIVGVSLAYFHVKLALILVGHYGYVGITA